MWEGWREEGRSVEGRLLALGDVHARLMPVQYSTAQYSSALHSTVQHSTGRAIDIIQSVHACVCVYVCVCVCAPVHSPPCVWTAECGSGSWLYRLCLWIAFMQLHGSSSSSSRSKCHVWVLLILQSQCSVSFSIFF